MNQSHISKLFIPTQSYIIKPSIESGGGKKIVVWKPNGGESLSDFISKIDIYSNCIVQEFATQHEELASLHQDSLNTIRIITFYHQGKAKALSTIIRMGVGGSTIDNASVGGIFCGVDNCGRLKNIAYNDYGEIFKTHPTTHAIFSEHLIPSFQELLELAEMLHNRFVVFSKLISWDFSIDKDGKPLLIEVNATDGGISFHQMCNGPLFGDLTKEVIKEVFNKRNKLLSYIF